MKKLITFEFKPKNYYFIIKYSLINFYCYFSLLLLLLLFNITYKLYIVFNNLYNFFFILIFTDYFHYHFLI